MTYRIKRVLLATDMSPVTTEACRHTLGLAAALGAKVHVLHVTAPLVVGGEGADANLAGGGRAAEEVSVEDEMRRRLADRLAEMRRRWAEVDGAPIPMEVHVVEGVAFEAILAEADRVGADIIVLGTHQRGLIRRLIEGSVSQKVAFGAEVPVLLVPVSQGEGDGQH